MSNSEGVALHIMNRFSAVVALLRQMRDMHGRTHLPLARLALHLNDVLQGHAAAAGGGEQQRLRKVLQFR